MTDGKGRTVDFRNTVLDDDLQRRRRRRSLNCRPRTPSWRGRKRWKRCGSFSVPDFMNRIDEIVIFNPLGKEQLENIVGLQMAICDKLAEERKITLDLTAAARRTAPQRRIRSGVWRAAVAAHDSTHDPGPAGDADSRRQVLPGDTVVDRRAEERRRDDVSNGATQPPRPRRIAVIYGRRAMNALPLKLRNGGDLVDESYQDPVFADCDYRAAGHRRRRVRRPARHDFRLDLCGGNELGFRISSRTRSPSNPAGRSRFRATNFRGSMK